MNDKTITAWVLAGGLLAAAMGAMTNDDQKLSPLGQESHGTGGGFVVPEQPDHADSVPQPGGDPALGPGRLRPLVGAPAAEVLGQVAYSRADGGAPVPGAPETPLVSGELAWSQAELGATQGQLQGYAQKDPGWLAAEVGATQGFAEGQAEGFGMEPAEPDEVVPGAPEPPEVPGPVQPPPVPPGGDEVLDRLDRGGKEGLADKALEEADEQLERAKEGASACASPPSLGDKLRCIDESATEAREDLQQEVEAVWSQATAVKETASREVRENGSALLEQARGTLDEAHDRAQRLPGELRDAAAGPLGEVQDAKDRCFPMEKRGLDATHERDLLDRARCADPRVGAVDDAVHEHLGDVVPKVDQAVGEALDESEARLDEAGDAAEVLQDLVGEHTDDWAAFLGDLHDPGPREG